MKKLLTKLLLALTLAFNPLSAFASEAHHLKIEAHDSSAALACDSPEYGGLSDQPDYEGCEPDCCEEAECSIQEACTSQQHSSFTSPISLIFDPSKRSHDRNAYNFDIPELELPPEPPPPIHI